ncbi:MAG: SDR family oxidoreductase [Chloroflexi bacterium]|nr:SDR family oxidoreductase [Chloroflexota bacterium]
MLLQGKVAMVTGAGGGIGKAIALRLAQEGARVVVVDRKGADAAAAEITARHAPAHGLSCDITREAEVITAFRAIAASHGTVDILVNNVGLLQRKPLLDMSEKEWDIHFNVNVKGAFFCSREAAKLMVQGGNGGRIICIASLSAKTAQLGMGAYGAAKSALVQMTKVLALELAPHNILVNVVAPGPTDTENMRRFFAGNKQAAVDDLVKGSLVEYRPPMLIGRLITTEEQANAVLFLASPGASGITGQVLYTAGGQDVL